MCVNFGGNVGVYGGVGGASDAVRGGECEVIEGRGSVFFVVCIVMGLYICVEVVRLYRY